MDVEVIDKVSSSTAKEVTITTSQTPSPPAKEEPEYVKIDFYGMLNHRQKAEIEHGLENEEANIRKRIEEDVAEMLKGPGRSGVFYSDEIAAKICSMVAAGLGLKRVCQFEGMPSEQTVWSWTIKNPRFAEAFELARYHRCHALAEEAMNIADSGENDSLPNGKPNWGAIQRDKLRIDTRHWYISRLCPSRYGANTDNQSNQNIVPVINVQISSGDV